MLGVPGQLANSGDGGAPAAQSVGGGGEVGGAGPSNTSTVGFGQEEDKFKFEEGDRSSGGNRWPRQETLALLKIRSDMDVVFRDSSLKGPLWEDVSRKLAELGYHRSAKKCKEKFENVYKYHKRTKEGRASKSDGGGKTYRFFDQLQALDNHAPHPSVPVLHPKPQPPVVEATPVAMAMPSTNHPIMSQVTFSATHPINISQINFTPPLNPTAPAPAPAPAPTPTPPPPQPIQNAAIPSIHHDDPMLNSPSSSSSSTSSDEEPERRGKRKRKRKWEYFFERLMNDVIGKQEEMQKKFLETLEKREHDRMAREEAWKLQEMARMNRDHDLLVQERSVAAAKDAAVIAFLQKISEQQQNPNASEMQMPFQLQENNLPMPRPPLPAVLATAPPPRPLPVLQTPFLPPPPLPQPQPQSQLPIKNVDTPKTDNGGENFTMASSSRWPKTEVQALIKLRTNLDLKYQDSGPKGPLWEEISAAMRKLGYNRNSKRCKEKWENINKYFKKVKDSNRKRPEDSKTCPYFDQLDALYREKNKSEASSSSFKSESNPVAPIMVRPEQQWPGGQEDRGSQNVDQNNDDDDDDDDDDGADEDEEDEGGGYEVVANKPSSMATVE